MRHQSYVYFYVSSKITSFLPSEGEFSEKLRIFSKVKKFQNPFCYILEKTNDNYDKKKFGYHDALKIYGGTKVVYRFVVKSPVLGLQRASENSEFAPSLRTLWISMRV